MKSTDLCGVVMVAKDEETDKLLIKAKAYLPSEVVNMKEITDKLPYSAYLNAGYDWIEATEGKFVNQNIIEDYVRTLEQTYNCRIKSVAFDSWGGLGLMSRLSDDFEIVDVKMTYKNFSPSIKKFRELVYDRKVIHEYNPVLNFCVSNAIVKQDLQENILLDKKKSANRIDLLVATIIAYSEWFNEDIEEEYTYFMV